MGALLALASALSYGLSDVLGGVLSRRISFVRVALLGQVGGLLVALFVAPLASGSPTVVPDLMWGALSGLGTGTAMVFLFRGMSRGAMSIVVPVSAVGGVALPVLVSTLAFGDRPAPLTWVGITIAVPAIWAVSRGPSTVGLPANLAVPDGLVSSIGIALQYLALAQCTAESGIWPVATGRVSAIVMVVVLARTLLSERPESPANVARSARDSIGAAFAGVLAAVALTFYLFATRTQFVAVAVVLASLYPVVPVLLGITALRERLNGKQALGLTGALGASVLIAVS